MPFPTSVDILVDGTTVEHASQVQGPQRITVGPVWVNVKSDQYGALGDGVTDDTTALAAALTAAAGAGGQGSGGIVYMPPGTYRISARLVVPYGVELRGCGRLTTTITALGSFPTSTELIRLGDLSGNIGVGCRIRGVAVDCNNIAGSTGIYSERINENSGVYECMVRNYGAYGIRINQPASGGVPQNWSIDDVEIFSGTATGATAIGLAVTATSLSDPFREISRVTIFASGSTQLTTAMKIDGASGGLVREIHIENAVNGILVGAVLGCFGLTFISLTGNPNVTSLLVVSNATSQDSIVAIGVNPQGGTNGIVDQLQGVTVPNQVGLYAFGTGGTNACPIFTTDVNFPTRLSRVVVRKDLARSVQTIAFAATITPDATAGEIVLVGTLTAAMTVANPTNSLAGQYLVFRYTQNATGGWVVTYGANYRTGGAVAAVTTLSTVTIDTFACENGTIWRLVSRTTGQAI